MPNPVVEAKKIIRTFLDFARNDRIEPNGNADSTLPSINLLSESGKLSASPTESDPAMSNDEFPKKEVETLWAPWRVQYFEKEPRDRDFLATAGRASDDAEHLVITRRKNAFLMMNRYPYTVGHLMVVPYRKVAELSALGENEVVELWNLVVHGQALLRAAVKAQGFNIGMNLGECAGAGVPDHLHIHVVPRWNGDTNFMPLIGGARVLSDGLRALYDKLMEAQTRMASPR
jgi:ATP adenylyltransferase